MRENRDKDWTVKDCKDVWSLFYNGKKKGKDLTLHPLLASTDRPGGRRQQFYRDEKSGEKVELLHLKKLYGEKCQGVRKAVPLTKKTADLAKEGVILTPVDEKLVKELDAYDEEVAVHEKIAKEAREQAAAERSRRAIVVAAAGGLAGLWLLYYLVRRYA